MINSRKIIVPTRLIWRKLPWKPLHFVRMHHVFARCIWRIVLFQHFLLKLLVFTNHHVKLHLFHWLYFRLRIFLLGFFSVLILMIFLFKWWFLMGTFIFLVEKVILDFIFLCRILTCNVKLFSWLCIFLHPFFRTSQNTLSFLITWSLKKFLRKPI